MEVSGEIRRLVGVLKMRGSRHAPHLLELIIDPPRIAVGAPLSQVDILGGISRAETVEETAARERQPEAIR